MLGLCGDIVVDDDDDVDVDMVECVLSDTNIPLPLLLLLILVLEVDDLILLHVRKLLSHFVTVKGWKSFEKIGEAC